MMHRRCHVPSSLAILGLLLLAPESIHAFTPPRIAKTVTTGLSISLQDVTSTVKRGGTVAGPPLNNSTSAVKRGGTVAGPPLDDKPDYQNIHGPLGKTLDKVFLTVFRSKMAEKVGVDSSLPKVSRINPSDGISLLGTIFAHPPIASAP